MFKLAIAAVLSLSSIAFAGEKEYYPGIEREYYLRIRHGVSRVFCNPTSAGAQAESSKLVGQNLYLTWKEGDRRQTVVFDLARGSAKTQEGAAVRVDASFNDVMEGIRGWDDLPFSSSRDFLNDMASYCADATGLEDAQ